jgi:hypothetical protein
VLFAGCAPEYPPDSRLQYPYGPPGAGLPPPRQTAAAQERYAEPPPTVIADQNPPAPLTEEVPPQTSAGTVWIDGYWNWAGDQWLWVDGRWAYPPQGSVYVEPYYDYGLYGYCTYIPGYWQPWAYLPYGVVIVGGRGFRGPRAHYIAGYGGYGRAPYGTSYGYGYTRDHRLSPAVPSSGVLGPISRDHRGGLGTPAPVNPGNPPLLRPGSSTNRSFTARDRAISPRVPTQTVRPLPPAGGQRGAPTGFRPGAYRGQFAAPARPAAPRMMAPPRPAPRTMAPAMHGGGRGPMRSFGGGGHGRRR